MKKVILASLAALLMAIPSSAKGYKIDGKISHTDGQKVIVYRGGRYKPLQALDSAIVRNGQFVITGRLSTPELLTLRFFKDANRSIVGEKGVIERPAIPLFIGNESVKITADADSLPKDFTLMYYLTFNPRSFTVTGSSLNDEFLNYRRGYGAAFNALEKGSKAYYDYLQNQVGYVSPMVGVREAKKVMQLRNERATFQKNYILAHTDDYVGLLAFEEGLREFSKDDIAQLKASFSPKLKKSDYGRWLMSQADTVMATARGAHFVDYPLEMADGKEAHLSDFLGKNNYTLLEFWASWCGPCRGSIPHLKQLYDLYHPQGFDILSVSIDADKMAWHKAIDQEQMKWHLAVPKGTPQEISRLYHFDGIPYCVLIDPKGNIVDTNTRDGFLDSYLIDIYGQKLDKVSVRGQLSDVTDTLNVAFSSMKDFPRNSKNLAPIVVDKDKKFSAEYTVDTPGYIIIYEAWPKQAAKKHQSLYNVVVPAIPGERLEIGGTTERPTYGGSYFYEEYGKMDAELRTQRDKVHSVEADSLIKSYERLSRLLLSARGKRQKTRLTNAVAYVRQQLEPIFEQESKAVKCAAFNYLMQHPRSEAAATLLFTIPSDSFDVAEKRLNYFVSHGRMKPFIEAARTQAENTLVRSKASESIKEGALAPDWSLRTLEGKQLALKDLRGKYVLLDFWGSWCGWCIKGIPEMKKAYAKHHDKVEFVSIDCDDTETKWKVALQKYQMPWLQVKNEKEDGVPDKYAVTGYPTKVLIDPNGKIVFIFNGEDPEFYNKLDNVFK